MFAKVFQNYICKNKSILFSVEKMKLKKNPKNVTQWFIEHNFPLIVWKRMKQDKKKKKKEFL